MLFLLHKKNFFWLIKKPYIKQTRYFYNRHFSFTKRAAITIATIVQTVLGRFC